MTPQQSAPVSNVTTLTPGEWLAAQSVTRDQEIATAMRLIAAGDRSNDACLHARQFLEHALGADRGSPLTSADYWQAANLLDGRGKAQAGAVLDVLAAVSWELQASTTAWHARYASRPETEPERHAAAWLRNGDLKESGQAARGIDGAHYTTAYWPRSGALAVVVTTSALTEEVVNFANKADAMTWLASRAPEAPGPLRTTATGPASRTAREEELLAYLIRDPGHGTRLAGTAGPATFTTHLRAELFAALRWASAEGGSPGYPVIAEAYGRRLLRAPAAAAEDIGWPGATRAMAYLHRLATTPVTAAQAETAASLLATVDAAARQARQQVPAAGPAPSRRTPAAATARSESPLLPPPAQVPGRGSPTPRL